MLFSRTAVVVVAVVLAASVAHAQRPERPERPRLGAGAGAGAGGKGARREEIRARVEQKIQTWLTVELSSRIGLDDKKSVKLAESIKAQMARKHDRRERARQEMTKLQELVDKKAPDGQVKAQLDTVIGAAGRDDDMHDFTVDTAKYLSVTEQAKLALAMPDIMKEMRRMMKETRKGMRRGGLGLGGPGGGDDD